MSARSLVSAGTSRASETNATNRPSALIATFRESYRRTSGRCRGTVTTSANAATTPGTQISSPCGRTGHLALDPSTQRYPAPRLQLAGFGTRANPRPPPFREGLQVDPVPLLDDVFEFLSDEQDRIRQRTNLD